MSGVGSDLLAVWEENLEKGAKKHANNPTGFLDKLVLNIKKLPQNAPEKQPTTPEDKIAIRDLIISTYQEHYETTLTRNQMRDLCDALDVEKPQSPATLKARKLTKERIEKICDWLKNAADQITNSLANADIFLEEAPGKIRKLWAQFSIASDGLTAEKRQDRRARQAVRRATADGIDPDLGRSRSHPHKRTTKSERFFNSALFYYGVPALFIAAGLLNATGFIERKDFWPSQDPHQQPSTPTYE